MLGPFLLYFPLKVLSPELLRACVGRGGSAGGTGKQPPRGAKAPPSPRSQLARPEGNPATPRPESPPAGQAMVGGNRNGNDSPVPFPRGSSPLVGKPGQTGPCRTHGHGPTQKAAPATRTDLGGRGGHGHARQQGLQGLRLEPHQRPLQWGQGSLQSPSKPQDNHTLPRVPPRSAPQPSFASPTQQNNPKSPQEWRGRELRARQGPSSPSLAAPWVAARRGRGENNASLKSQHRPASAWKAHLSLLPISHPSSTTQEQGSPRHLREAASPCRVCLAEGVGWGPPAPGGWGGLSPFLRAVPGVPRAAPDPGQAQSRRRQHGAAPGAAAAQRLAPHANSPQALALPQNWPLEPLHRHRPQLSGATESPSTREEEEKGKKRKGEAANPNVKEPQRWRTSSPLPKQPEGATGRRPEASPGLALRQPTVHRFPSHPPWLENCRSPWKAESRAQLCTTSECFALQGHRQPEQSLDLPVHLTADSQSTPRHRSRPTLDRPGSRV